MRVDVTWMWLRVAMATNAPAEQGDLAAGSGVPDANEEAARRTRKVLANRASAARSKERKKAITVLEQQVPSSPTV